ncbi:MAG: hypothetical protein ACYDBV_14225 [Nitrospiria bacterium]
MKLFKRFWKELNKTGDALSDRQLEEVQDKMWRWDSKHVKYSDQVKRLQRTFPKLREQYRAEQVVRTEGKRLESDDVKNDAVEIGLKSFKIMLSPNACEMCRGFTNEGSKVFKADELKKGEWDVPPIHPQCNCVLIPLNS